MEDEKDSSLSQPKKANWGGARQGAGRPKGSIDKVTVRYILENAEKVIGKPLMESILEGYHDTIVNGDTRNRVVYEKMLLDKVASNLFDVEVSDTDQTIEAKQAAFAAALSRAMGTDETAK